MKQRQVIEDTSALLAGSLIIHTSRFEEHFPDIELDRQIKQLQNGQRNHVQRCIFIMVLGILLFSQWLPAVAQTEQFQIAYGDIISDGVPAPGAGNIEAGGALDVYSFQALAGDEVIFDTISGSSGQFFWLLNAPDGAVLFDTFNADRRIAMPQSGLYTLTIRGANPATTGTYSLRIMLVPAPQQFGINVGDTVSENVPTSGAGSIEAPGAVDTYTFSGVAGQGIIFDALIGSTGQFRVILFAPDGTQLFNGFYMDHQAVLSLNGVYNLRVEGLNLDSVGGYSFQLVPMAVTQEFNISINDTVADGIPMPGAGNLEAPGALDIYYFQGAAGQGIIFDVLNGATGQFWVLLSAPDGSIVFDTFFVDQQVTLPQNGIYTLTVSGGQVTGFGTYSFQLLHVPPAAQEFNISIGDTVSDGVPAPGAGHLESPGAVDLYRLNGSAGQGMIFHVLAGDTGLFRVTLAAPDGTELFNAFLVDQQATLPQTGTYMLSVRGLNVASFGTYSFALQAVIENSDPVANDDTITTDEDLSVIVDVLANDTDLDNDVLAVDNVSQPAMGSVVNNGVNVTYMPAPDFHGVDSFSYTVSDGEGGTATAAVTVIVNPVNDLPVIDVASDPIETDEGLVVTRAFILSDVDGDLMTAYASSGEIDDLSGGNYQWRYLADDGPASITVTLAVDDGWGGIASASFDVSVHNVSPTATLGNTTGPITAPGTTTLTFSNQADPSQADTVAGFLYSYDCTGSGTFDVTSTTSADFDCVYSVAGVYTAHGRIQDKDGGFSDLFAEVNVESTPNNPPQAYNDAATTDENVPVTIDVLVNDTDPDGDPLIIENVAQPANGVVVQNGNTLIYTPNSGFYGIDTFSYVASDTLGGQDTAEVVVTVLAVVPPEPVTITVPITRARDDVNESGRVLITRSPLLWISSIFWGDGDYLGLRFNNVDIPQSAIIEEAYLEVYSPLKGWFYFDVEFRADGADHSVAFTRHNRPSQRSATQSYVTQVENAHWTSGSWQRFVDIAPVIQEVTNQAGWQSGNSLSLIARSKGRHWTSVLFASYDLNPSHAPRLVIRYRQD